VQDARLAVDVGAMETKQLLGPQTTADGDNRHYAIPAVKLGADRVDLPPGLKGEHGSALVPLPLRVADTCARITATKPTSKRPSERLAERSKDAVARAWRKLLAPVLELYFAEAIGVPIAELGAGLPKLRRQLPLCRPIDRATVPLEKQIEEQVDRLRTVSARDQITAPKCENLIDLVVEPVAGGALRLKATLPLPLAVLVVPPCGPTARRQPLDTAVLLSRHLLLLDSGLLA
jgi:hypothetical protein